MSSIKIDKNKCNMCLDCIDVCPFNAMENIDDAIQVNAACKMCKICIKACKSQAISIIKKEDKVDKEDWQGILVYAEFFEGNLHPVTIELLGIAKVLAKQVNMPVYCLLIGHDVKDIPKTLLEYSINKVFVYDNIALKNFRVDTYANVFENLIKDIMPSIVLIGSTSIGRSLAPRVSTRFKTGLTADCTTLKIKENSDLVQIRPAFGGNIMAQILTPNTRPQFATVRYKVMDCALKGGIIGSIEYRNISQELLKSDISVLEIIKKEEELSITDVDVLVVAGQGVKEQKDLSMIKELAFVLDGEYAVTRPLVEKGWADYTRQIGLSGRTVKPKLIITCGVSGAIQFRACMNASEKIIAINTDENAPIFTVAHYKIIGDIYDIIPKLITQVKEGSGDGCAN